MRHQADHAAVLRLELDDSLDEGLECLRAAVRVEAPEQALDVLLEDRPHQVDLGREVPVDGADPKSCATSYFLNARVGPEFGEGAARGLDEARSVCKRVAAH